MNKLLFALIAGLFSAAAIGQTGVVDTSKVADHGTPAMHAQEAANNVNTSRSTKGLQDGKARQQAVKDTTKVADHGTPAGHAEEASKNVSASKNGAKALDSKKAAQDAVQTATKGQTK